MLTQPTLFGSELSISDTFILTFLMRQNRHRILIYAVIDKRRAIKSHLGNIFCCRNRFLTLRLRQNLECPVWVRRQASTLNTPLFLCQNILCLHRFALRFSVFRHTLCFQTQARPPKFLNHFFKFTICLTKTFLK
jgi:hypothetical protein